MDQLTGRAAQGRALEYDGRVGELYGIFLMNLLWTILTLGIFRFWAITRYRRYFWSRTRFQGERFQYTGTGGELFVGYLLAGLMIFGAAVVAAIVGFILLQVSEVLLLIPVFGFYLFFAILAAGAIFSAQRYRLSRTLWCGIRGGMTGSVFAYGGRAIIYGLLALVTLFQTVPWAQIRLTERRINASSFGSMPFRFAGRARVVYPAYLLTLVLSLALAAVTAWLVWSAVGPALLAISIVDPRSGASSEQLAALQMVSLVVVAAVIVFSLLSAVLRCWYVALFERHVLGNTNFATLQLASTMSGTGLLGLVVGNLFIAVFTLGLGYPVLLHRNARFLARTVWCSGGLDPAELLQSTQASPRFGEGMYQQLDSSGGML